VFQRFSTIDAISSGRGEVILGRGSFTESFPLFGLDLRDYDQLFEEKLDFFTHLLTEEPITWEGRLRMPLRNQRVYPPTQNGLRTWIAVGGSPESVIRAAKHRLPLMLAVIGGPVERFVPFADLYRRANDQLGQPQAPIGVHSPGHIADTDAEARDHLREHWLENRNRLGRERGWGPAGEREFIAEIEEGALYVGSPETVAAKIAHAVRTLGVDRFDLKYANGPMPHEQLMRSIELYGTEVIPRVRALLAE
jgi:alkanesulfonate monooxygenase SsuD/methylene tetrahydromethanopterin reductase-like flavin-dependent oxidoreductase (luciferase family)